jgi:glycosyltransferase involved in cell wall biosynthesis
MKIGLTSNHRYPARLFPVGDGGRAGARITDLLAKGLAELGHEVHYYVEHGFAAPPPAGAIPSARPFTSADVMHLQHNTIGAPVDPSWPPWVRTCHGDNALRFGPVSDKLIFVSRTHAASHGRTRFVHNGIDPAEFIFSESKLDYFLFMCDLDRAIDKGLRVAVEATARAGAELVVAGKAGDPAAMQAVDELCAAPHVRRAGEVRGSERAELLAGARALLFPTQTNESFGLVMVEALVSGTPVIASNRGACRELLDERTSFICDTLDDYIDAMSRTEAIAPRTCREKALRDYHYLRMAAGYAAEYERELDGERAVDAEAFG